jgi:hypothetical protein
VIPPVLPYFGGTDVVRNPLRAEMDIALKKYSREYEIGNEFPRVQEGLVITPLTASIAVRGMVLLIRSKGSN